MSENIYELGTGVYTALMTFTEGKSSDVDNPIDLPRMISLMQKQSEAGVKGVVLFGTSENIPRHRRHY